ncbi:unnamed protein product [Arctogadus glacialis]
MAITSATTQATRGCCKKTVKGYWFLVPLFAPFLGAVQGVVVYQLMVGYNMEGEERIQRLREVL